MRLRPKSGGDHEEGGACKGADCLCGAIEGDRWPITGAGATATMALIGEVPGIGRESNPGSDLNHSEMHPFSLKSH